MGKGQARLFVVVNNTTVENKPMSSNIREDIGYTRPQLPDSREVMSRIEKHKRDKHVSLLLEEHLRKQGRWIDGVEPWPTKQKQK